MIVKLMKQHSTRIQLSFYHSGRAIATATDYDIINDYLRGADAIDADELTLITTTE